MVCTASHAFTGDDVSLCGKEMKGNLVNKGRLNDLWRVSDGWRLLIPSLFTHHRVFLLFTSYCFVQFFTSQLYLSEDY